MAAQPAAKSKPVKSVNQGIQVVGKFRKKI